jgi:Domain of unknown function (DUF2017)
MRLKRENDTLLLSLNAMEARVFLRVLRLLADNYRLAPGDLAEPAASAWYSTRGCASAGMSGEETREWLAHLHAFKGARLEKIKDWAAQLDETKAGAAQVRVSLDDAPTFISAINDHRLLLAARYHIGQEEMDARSMMQVLKLPSATQEALMEIHFLAWIIEETLRVLAE